jgi:hypothetical protein
VSRFRNKLFAVVVMAVWLFATQHCGLEAAGLLAGHDESAEGSSCCSTSGGCENDGCATVEDGAYRPDQSALVISAPVLSVDAFLVLGDISPPRQLQAELALTRDAFERPHDWVTTWQFVQRAALSPRAPSVI